MGRRAWFSAIVVAALAMVLAYAGIRSFRASKAKECYACSRPIHAHSKTVALANGRARVFCCPACALSEHQQEDKPVKVTELTSFLTGATLSPDSAYVVKGSDVNMCATTHGLIADATRPADVQYDRCSPSLLAFAQRIEAVEFVREHGGEVLPFKEVASAFSK
jgi:NosL